jgi:hypothetical protein
LLIVIKFGPEILSRKLINKIGLQYDIGNAFLARHTSETDKLFDDTIGYFSPMLIAAFDLTPEQVNFLTLWDKSLAPGGKLWLPG